MDLLFRFDRFFPNAFPPLLTMLVCLFLASLTIHVGQAKRENRIFTLFCLTQALYNLDLTLRTFVASKEMALSIIRFDHVFFVFIIPLAIHFVHEVLHLSYPWLIRGLYAFGVIMLGFSQSDYYISGVEEFFFGFAPKSGPLLLLYAVITWILTSVFAGMLLIRSRQETDPQQLLRLRFVFWGFLSNLLLGLGNILPALGVTLYPPGNFGFLPMGLMAYGLLQHQVLDTAKSWISKGYLPRLLIALIWAPLVLSVLYWIYAAEGVFYPNLVEHLIPYAIPPTISFLTCFSLATFCFLKGRRKLETILFGLICLLWGGLSLDKTLEALVMQESVALQIARIDHFFLVSQSAISIHFIYLMIGRPQRLLITVYYILGLLLMPLTQSPYYYQETMHHYYFGFFGKGDWAFQIFGGTGLIGAIWCSYLLLQAWRRETDVMQKKVLRFLFGGIVVSAILNIGNIPATRGIEFYPLGNFTFIPILVLAYGVFRHDIIKINVYSKKRLLGVVVKIVVLLGYLALAPLVWWALQGHTFWELLPQIYPYGAAPLVSFLVCTFFVGVALKVGGNQKESLIFSLLCLLYAFLNLDVFLNGMVPDASMGLQITRWNHFFLVSIFALNIHLVYAVSHYPKRKWVLWLAYGFGLVMAPFTQTSYYFQGTYHYDWGFFAKKAILFDVVVVCAFLTVIYTGWLLYQEFQKTENASQKHRFRFLFLGMISTGLLNLGSLPAVYGYEIYPSGNFTFIPILLFAYGMFKHNFREVLQIANGVLFWLGLLLAIVAVLKLPHILLPSGADGLVLFLEMALILLLLPLRNGWHAFLSLFFGKEREDLKQTFEKLSDRLSKEHTLQDTFDAISDVLLHTLLSHRCVMLVSSKNTTGFVGWESWNCEKGAFSLKKVSSPERSVVSLEADHPLFPLFYEHQEHPRPIRQEEYEEWILNHELELDIHDPLRQSALIQPIFFEDQLVCLLLLDNKIDSSSFSSHENEFLYKLGLVLGVYLENTDLLEGLNHQILKLEKTTDIFQKFVPKQFLTRIATEGLEKIELGRAESDVISILFSDIRSFTTLSETMTPQELLNFLNAYLKRMSEPIHAHSGFVDKFIGDAIMALFDRQEASDAEEAQDAVEAAIDMQAALRLYNRDRLDSGYRPIAAGVGIHTGQVIIGTVGSEDRFDSTALGDAVNLASRLEGLTKHYNSSIIISSATYRLLDDDFPLLSRELDFVSVKGKDEPVTIFEIFNGDDEPIRDGKQRISQSYHEGLMYYYAQQWSDAIALFRQCLTIYPGDVVTQMYLKRAMDYQASPPGSKWTGAEKLTQK